MMPSSNPPLHFLIPDPRMFPSGGNIYNAQLIKALQAKVDNLKVSHDPQQLSLDDPQTILFVDTLFLEEFDPGTCESSTFLITHHLESLDAKTEAEGEVLIAKEKKVLQDFDGFLCTSNFTSQYLKETIGMSQPTIQVLPALSVLESLNEKEIKKNQRTVLMVGNLLPRKGILPFLQEWSQYAWPIDFRLEIIGDLELDANYAEACLAFWKNLASEKKSQVSFLGALDQSLVLEKYQEADALVSASTMETFGMALQEAVAAALPLFVLEGGHAQAHVQNGNGASFIALQELVLALKHWSETIPLQASYAHAAKQLALAEKRNWSTAAEEFLTQIKKNFLMPENAFDTTWLNTRYPFDEAARNQSVDQAAMAFLKTLPATGKKELRFLDIGSGTGANFLHFYESLPFAQNWILMDHDPRLLQASLQRIEAEAKAKAYPVFVEDHRLRLVCPDGDVCIEVLSGAFEEVEKLVALASLDLVMASAFFDLFTREKLDHFLQKIKKASCGLLLTLNYSEMTFSPELSLDKKVVQWYEAHMQRPQNSGAAMGPDCSRQIQASLENGAIDFVAGKSIWKIGEKDQAMSRFLLGFMEEAIGELALPEKEQEAFEDWLRIRKKELEEEGLALEVAHFDFFATSL